MSDRARPRPRPPRPPARRLRGPSLRQRRRPRAGGVERGPPRVTAILVGPPVWRGRGWFGRLAAALATGETVRVPWEEVEKIDVGGAPEEDRARASARTGRRQGAPLRGVDPGLMMRLSDLLGARGPHRVGRPPGPRPRPAGRADEPLAQGHRPRRGRARPARAARRRRAGVGSPDSHPGRRSVVGGRAGQPASIVVRDGTQAGNRLPGLPLYLTEAQDRQSCSRLPTRWRRSRPASSGLRAARSRTGRAPGCACPTERSPSCPPPTASSGSRA